MMETDHITALDRFHPVVQGLYFAAIIVFTMAVMHPVYLVLALVGAFSYHVYLRGWHVALRSLAWQLPILLLVAVANPFFSPSGSTELFLIGERAIYQESLIYGLCMGAMLVSMVIWLSNAAAVMSFDKIVMLVGSRMPTIGLMLSMSARLMPTLVHRGREIRLVAEACTARTVSAKTLLAKKPFRSDTSGSEGSAQQRVQKRMQESVFSANGHVRNADNAVSRMVQERIPSANQAPSDQKASRFRLSQATRENMRITTVLMGWAMEDSLTTADSMRARGWGAVSKRSVYVRYVFRQRDGVACALLIFIVAINAFLAWVACSQFHFYPTTSMLVVWWGYIPFAFLAFLPIIAEGIEWLRWRGESWRGVWHG